MNELSRSVRGHAVLVTGAGSGMGRATAKLFAAEGAHVAVTDYSLESAQAVADEITAMGGSARAWKLDVSDQQQIRRGVAAIAEHWGGLDVLINNAGILGFVGIEDEGYDEMWDRNLAVHLTGQQRMVRAALPYLKKSAFPRVVNIASTEALGAMPRNSPYSAAKAGVTGLTRALAVDLGREGITVNCICPGPIDTGMTLGIPDVEREKFVARRTVLRRWGMPEEVAHMTLSICLPAMSFMTGAVIPVDGGLLARNS